MADENVEIEKQKLQLDRERFEQSKIDKERELTQAKEIQERAWEIQSKLKDKDLEIQREQITVQKSQVALGRFSLGRLNLSSSGITLVVSLVAVMGTIGAGIQQSTQNRILEQKKFDYQKQIEQQKADYQEKADRRKFQSDLTVNAIKTGNSKDAKENLLFLLDAHLLDDPGNAIITALSKHAPVLPATDGQSSPLAHVTIHTMNATSQEVVGYVVFYQYQAFKDVQSEPKVAPQVTPTVVALSPGTYIMWCQSPTGKLGDKCTRIIDLKTTSVNLPIPK